MAPGAKLLLRASSRVMVPHCEELSRQTECSVTDTPGSLSSHRLFPTPYSQLSANPVCKQYPDHPLLSCSAPTPRLSSLGHSHTTPRLPGPAPCVLSPAAKESFSNCKSDRTVHVLKTHQWLSAHSGQNQSPPYDSQSPVLALCHLPAIPCSRLWGLMPQPGLLGHEMPPPAPSTLP